MFNKVCLILVFCFIGLIQTQAQGWEDGTRWVYKEFYFPIFGETHDQYLELITNGDTIIQDKSFSIIEQYSYKINDSISKNRIDHDYYVSYEQDRIHWYDPESDDIKPLYDFNLQAGDTLDYFCPESQSLNKDIVDSVAYMNIADEIRKVFYTTPFPENQCYMSTEIIEGIGQLIHLFPTYCCVDPPPGGTIVCHQSGDVSFPDGCDFDLIEPPKYNNLIVDNTNWFVVDTYVGFGGSFIAYSLSGDTIVNAKNYKKVIKRDLRMSPNTVNPQPPYGYYTESLFGFMREDISTKKVYSVVIDSSFNSLCDFYESEQLHYDFSLEVGDKYFNPCFYPDTLTVMEISEKELYGELRKTFIFDSFDQGYDLKLVEGIGFHRGLFRFNYSQYPVPEVFMSVVDHCIGTDEECNLFETDPPVSTDDIYAEQFTIYPNPANDIINIESDINTDNISLYTKNGQLLWSGVESTLDLSQYPSGLYFLVVQKKDNRIIKKVSIVR